MLVFNSISIYRLVTKKPTQMCFVENSNDIKTYTQKKRVHIRGGGGGGYIRGGGLYSGGKYTLRIGRRIFGWAYTRGGGGGGGLTYGIIR